MVGDINPLTHNVANMHSYICSVCVFFANCVRTRCRSIRRSLASRKARFCCFRRASRRRVHMAIGFAANMYQLNSPNLAFTGEWTSMLFSISRLKSQWILIFFSDYKPLCVSSIHSIWMWERKQDCAGSGAYNVHGFPLVQPVAVISSQSHIIGDASVIAARPGVQSLPHCVSVMLPP